MYNLFSKIRDCINSPRKQYKLLKQIEKWNKLCSSLDLLEDTQSAITYYESSPFPSEVSGKYLFIYGLYQALFLQQDAIKHIAQSLDISYEPSIELYKIREIRNDCVGHPSERTISKNNKNYIFLVQHFLGKKGFEIIRHFGNKESNFEHINTEELIVIQKKEVKSVLIQFYNILIEEENKYKSMFKSKMADIIPTTTNYCISKLFEGIGDNKDSSYKQLAKIHADILLKMAKDFEGELKKRDIWESSEYTNYIVTDIIYPINELIKFYNSDKSNKLNNQDARIFATYIHKQFEDLKKHAKEIDDDFKKKTPKIKS